VKVTVWGKQLFFKGNVHNWVRRLFTSYDFTGREAVSWQEGFTWNDIHPILELLIREDIISVNHANR
jgi:hypothetical protein